MASSPFPFDPCLGCTRKPHSGESLFCSDQCRARYSRDPPQSIACCQCDGQADSLKEVIASGWTDLDRDVEGYTWNYLGLCPECARG